MGNGGPHPVGFSIRVLEAALIVVPVLVLVAIVILLTTRDGDGPPQALPPITVSAGPSKAPLADSPVQPSRDPVSTITAQAEERQAGPSTRGDSPVVWVHRGERIDLFDSPNGDVVARVGDETEFGSPSVLSVLRQDRRWIGVSSPLRPNGEVGWVKADPRKLGGGFVDYAVVVDLSDRSASLLERGEEVRSWPVTVGAPGSETPTGTFAVTDTFRGGLNPVYGCCAVALSATQPNLPSGWLGGNRIAFHGTGGPTGIAASNGCIRSADRDVNALVKTVPLGTPVRIRD